MDEQLVVSTTVQSGNSHNRLVHRIAALLCLLSLPSLCAQERPLPNADQFMAQVKARLASDDTRQSGYMYLERRTEEKLDATGRPLHLSQKVFEVYPGIPGEARYRRLIEDEGRPIAPATLASEDRKRQRVAQDYVNRLSTKAGREQDAQRRDKERREEAAAIDDLFRIYDIRLVGRESVDKCETIVATLTPKRGATASTDDGKMMRHFTARAWISEADNEVVRVEIEALDDLSIGWGLFARVHKGARATYQRRKVNDEIWLPAAVTWSGTGRLLLFKQVRERGRSEFFDYRKFTVGTSTTYTTPAP
jgi:ribosomal protein L34